MTHAKTTEERLTELEAKIDETTATLNDAVKAAVAILERLRAGELTDPNRIDIAIGDLMLTYIVGDTGGAQASNGLARARARDLRVALAR